MSEKAEAEAPQSSAVTAAEETPAAETPVTETPAATQPATGDTETSTAGKPPNESDKGEAVVGVVGYEKMLAEATAKAATRAREQSAEKWEQAKAAAKADEAVSEEARTGSTASAGTVADGAGGQSSEAGDQTGAEETATEAAGTAAATEETTATSDKRIRLKGLKDGHLVEAANEIARAEGISFTEAFERVAPKKAGGQKPETSDQTAATGTTLRTREAINADILAKKAAKREAAKEMDNVAIIDAEDAIEALKDELDQVAEAERRAEQARLSAEETKFGNDVSASQARALKDWPEAGVDGSEFSNRMLELSDQLAKDPDPELRRLVADADAPFVIARMVAKEQGILPKHLRKAAPASNGANTTVTKPTTPAATKPAPLLNQRAVGRPTQPAASPASGAARTTQGGQKDDLGLDKIHSPHDYEKLVDKLKKQPVAA